MNKVFAFVAIILLSATFTFAQTNQAGGGDFTVPTRGGSTDGGGSSSGGGGSNPGAFIIMAQQKALQEAKAREEAELKAQLEARPKPKKEIEEPVIQPETQLEPIPELDLSAMAESSNNFDTKDIGLAILGIFVAGFAAYKLSTRNTPENKEKRKGKRCMHVGAILEANLKEMTSLEEKLQDIVEDKIDSSRVALAKKLLKLKKRREKFSKLFEDCVIKTADKKNIIVVHADDAIATNAWVLMLKSRVKKEDFDIKVVDVKNLEGIKPSKNTLFIHVGNVSQIVDDHFKGMEDYSSVASSDILAVVEKLKRF